MELKGDPAGIAALKEMKEHNREYLKFLIGEARSNTDHEAFFKNEAGERFRLALLVPSGDIEITHA